MAVISGFLLQEPGHGGFASDPSISDDLNGMSGIGWPPVGQAIGFGAAGAITSALPVSAAPRTLSGFKSESYLDDFYYRIHVIPAVAAAGNIVTDKVVPILFWNAHLASRTLSSITLANTSGVTVDSEVLPWVFTALREYTFDVNVSRAGEPTIDGTILFDFNGSADDKNIPVTGMRVTAWTFQPDWSRGVLERMEWLTNVITTYDGSEQRISLRQYPRRAMEFDYCTITGKMRRRLETLLFAWGSMPWALPIWTDGVTLIATLPQGASFIAMDTSSSDYHDGGLLILIGSEDAYEIVEIYDAGAGGVVLSAPTQQAWPAGTRVYPARLAQLEDSHRLSRFTGDAAYSSIKFRLTDNSEVAVSSGTTYRGYPILTQAPVWVRDLTMEYQRKLEVIDFGIGAFSAEDEAELPIMVQAHHWTLTSKAEVEAFRAWLYARRGKARACWVPNFLSDLVLVADIGAGASTIDVEACLYTRYIGMAINRRDIAIMLRSGTVIYRRITGAFELSATVERLTIDTAITQTIAPADVEKISFMSLSRLDSDTVEFAWWTDEVADVTANFRSFRHGV